MLYMQGTYRLNRTTVAIDRTGHETSCIQVPEGTLVQAEDVRLQLKDGQSAGLTLHTIDGTIPQLRRAMDRSLDAFFDLLPGADEEDQENFGD